MLANLFPDPGDPEFIEFVKWPEWAALVPQNAESDS